MCGINHFGSFFFDADLIDRHLNRSALDETITLLVIDKADSRYPCLHDDSSGCGTEIDYTSISCSTVAIMGTLVRGSSGVIAGAAATELGFWNISQYDDETPHMDRIYMLNVTTIKLNEEPRGRSVSVNVEDYYAVDADELVRCILQS